jgi:hypothetical protein
MDYFEPKQARIESIDKLFGFIRGFFLPVLPILLILGAIILRQAQRTVSIEVVCQVPKADFDRGAHDADASQYHVASSLGLDAEDMLYSRSRFRPSAVTLLLFCRQRAIPASLALEMFPVSLAAKVINPLFRTVCRVRPYVAAGVASIEQLVKDIAVMDFGARYLEPPDQFMLRVH